MQANTSHPKNKNSGHVLEHTFHPSPEGKLRQAADRSGCQASQGYRMRTCLTGSNNSSEQTKAGAVKIPWKTCSASRVLRKMHAVRTHPGF